MFKCIPLFKVCNLEGGQAFHILGDVGDVIPWDVKLDKVGEVLDLWWESLDLVVAQAKLPEVVQLEEAGWEVPGQVGAVNYWQILNVKEPEMVGIEKKLLEASGVSHDVLGHIVQRTVPFVHVLNLKSEISMAQNKLIT